ncbi:MAG: acyltransferase [Limosilactobacillus sp.]|nr:acyltransferase [Limosilactobacillus sp.]
MKQGTRIGWIDIAKGLAMLSIVLGHALDPNVKVNQVIETILYSFDVPLFFILSGLTTKVAIDWHTIAVKVKNLIVKIYLPTLIAAGVIVVERGMMLHFDVLQYFKSFLGTVIFAEAIGSNGHSPIGPLWFIMTFFWAKVFYLVGMKLLNNQWFFGGLTLVITLLFNMMQVAYLIQSLDLVPVACFLMWVGWLFQRKIDSLSYALKKYWWLIMLVWLLTLGVDFSLHTRLDLAIRSLPGCMVALVQAITGTMMVSYLARRLQATWVGHGLQMIGRYSFSLLIINSIDFFGLWSWLNRYVTGYGATLVKLGCDLGIFDGWYGIKNARK